MLPDLDRFKPKFPARLARAKDGAAPDASRHRCCQQGRQLPLGHGGILEFLHGQILRLAVDRNAAARADAPRDGEIAGDRYDSW